MWVKLTRTCPRWRWGSDCRPKICSSWDILCAQATLEIHELPHRGFSSWKSLLGAWKLVFMCILVYWADIIQAPTRDKVTRGSVRTGHHPGGAQGDGVDLNNIVLLVLRVSELHCDILNKLHGDEHHHCRRKKKDSNISDICKVCYNGYRPCLLNNYPTQSAFRLVRQRPSFLSPRPSAWRTPATSCCSWPPSTWCSTYLG